MELEGLNSESSFKLARFTRHYFACRKRYRRGCVEWNLRLIAVRWVEQCGTVVWQIRDDRSHYCGLVSYFKYLQSSGTDNGLHFIKVTIGN